MGGVGGWERGGRVRKTEHEKDREGERKRGRDLE